MTFSLNWCVAQYASDAQFQRDLDHVAQVSPGCHVRLDAVWRYVDPKANGQYDWTDLDRRIGEVTARKLVPHLMIPYWCPDPILAGAPDKTQIKTDTALNLAVLFVRALGQRYGNVVRSAELGNEPNLRYPFCPDGADPLWQAKVTVAFSSVLPATWRLGSPGLAPASDGGGSLSALTYLQTYWPLAGPHLNFCCIHPYGRVADVNQSWSLLGALGKIHTLTGAPIWATEYNSDGSDSDTQKATNVPLGLTYMRDLGFVHRAFLYAMSDPGTDASVRWGALNSDGSQRRLYGACDAWV